jgi:hypothetical protein
MGKKLDKLVSRIEALEKAIAAMLTGKKKQKKAKRPAAKKKAKKSAAKAPAPKKTKRRARKARPVTPPLALTGTL